MKNKLSEALDPNEKVDDYLLNKRVGLDGEKMALYKKIQDWVEDIGQNDYICQLDYDERKDKIMATLQEKKGPKYLILHYWFRNKTLELTYLKYDDGKDSLEVEESEKTNSPSNTDYLLKKYKSFLMEKQPLTEQKNKTYSESEIDDLIRKASTSIHRLKEAVKGHLDGGKFVKQLDAIYKVLQDTPSLNTLKTQLEKEKRQREIDKAAALRDSVREDIKIDAKSDPNTVRKAEELAKKNDTDIELTTESISVGDLKRLLKEAQTKTVLHSKKIYNTKSLVESLLVENAETPNWVKEQIEAHSDEYSQYIDFDNIFFEGPSENSGLTTIEWSLKIPTGVFSNMSKDGVLTQLKKELNFRTGGESGAHFSRCTVNTVTLAKGFFVASLTLVNGYDV